MMTLGTWDAIADLPAQQLAVIERRTAEIGRELFARLERQRSHVLQRRWWDDRLMQWSMRDEEVKVQLFRFVDVLPMLQDSESVCQHLFEYLEEVRDRLPGPANAALGLARRNALTRSAVARAARLSAMDLARRFIAGTNPREVLDAARRERDQNRAFTLDILGEAVISEREADQFLRAYIELIENVAPEVNRWPVNPQVDLGVLGPLPRMNLSIKLSALDARFDPIDSQGVLRRAGERFRRLLRVARHHDAFINVDMESYEKKDLTLWLFQQVLMEDEFREIGDVGIVVQCYLRDAGRDLQQLRDWAEQRGKPIWVRLVKGAYWDYETIHARSRGWPLPVFDQKWQSDASFERATRFLMQHAAHLRPALGSHNLRSLAHGIAVAEHLQLSPRGYEIQMLYGMADQEKQALVQQGQRLRVYMPHGELIPGMAYLVRRLLENTSNDSFLRAGFVEGVPPEQLLANPLQASSSSTATQHEAPMASAPSPPSRPTRFRNEPPVDFAQQQNRQRMRDALREVASQLGRDYLLHINGRDVPGSEWLSSEDPSHRDRLVGRVAAADEAQVAQAVAAARDALPGWRDFGARRRAALLRKVAQRFRDRFFEMASWQVYECGKGWREAAGDVCEAIDFCEYYALGAEALQEPDGADVPGEENRFLYEPRGVTAVIAPWNFPLAILTGMTTAALATGNTVIMKPAEQSAVVAAHLQQVLNEVGVPPGVCQFLPGHGEVVGARLVEHPDVALIAFTGSRAVGLQINATAAEVSARGSRVVKRVIAEMGGKNAIIIDADADLDEAVQGVVQSAFAYQGQKCSACSRAIVLEDVYEPFLQRLIEAARSLRIGPAEDPSSDIGPVISQEAYDRIQEYLRVGRDEAREELRVEVSSDMAAQGYYIGPHIFADVPPTARIAQEEIFGPVLAVIRARDIDRALEIANDTDYALTGGIYSRSPQNLQRACREFLVGNLYLNRPIIGALVGRQPFGGFRMSGIGSKAGGPDYLLQFVVPRTVTENTMRRGFAPA